jgi:hypothetical protein
MKHGEAGKILQLCVRLGDFFQIPDAMSVPVPCPGAEPDGGRGHFEFRVDTVIVVMVAVGLQRPFSAEPMRVWPVSTRVSKPENDDPSVVELVKLTMEAA